MGMLTRGLGVATIVVGLSLSTLLLSGCNVNVAPIATYRACRQIVYRERICSGWRWQRHCEIVRRVRWNCRGP